MRWPLFPTLIDPLARDGEPAGDPPAGDPPAADPPPADSAPAGLLSGKAPEGQPPAASSNEFQVPEKFLVKGEDGTPDWKAIAEKALPAYSHLEKRMGSGEAPPESPDKYKIDDYLPEGYERNPEAEKGVLSQLHELGLNNKQAQGVLSYYGQLLGQGVEAEKQSMDQAMATLKTEVWKGDGEYDKNLNRANFALSTLGESDVVQQITSDPKLMNNPALIRLLAKMGAELEDDKAANQMDGAEIEDIDQLRGSEAYLDPKHPDHKRVQAKVAAAYARGYKSSNR